VSDQIYDRFALLFSDLTRRTRAVRTLSVVVAIVAVTAARGAAQAPLTTLLFERYMNALRAQANIPGMSGVIIQNRTVIWGDGFGFADIQQAIPARPDTPYRISGLTEILSSALLLEQCEETGHASLDDPIQAHAIAAPDPAITIRDALTHRSAAGSFTYDEGRFTALTGVLETCIQKEPIPFRQALGQKVFDRFGMADSVPSPDVANRSADDRVEFGDDALARYTDVLQRLATPYRISGGSASPIESVPGSVDAATGAISTVLDLARVIIALDSAGWLHRDTLGEMWSNATTIDGAVMPTGLGWFVQTYNGRDVYWQFGDAVGASSLILKVPSQRLTLILLANSDGLSAPFSLRDGDVTTSLFARTFLKLFVG
jgi:CubicO group peptidase (beta-lactamase class C family)